MSNDHVNNGVGTNSSPTPMQSILVFSEIDDRKFKMVMRGDLRMLSVDKIKRYLERSTGIPNAEQLLMYNGLVLTDDMVGEDFNLQSNATLRLSKIGGISRGGGGLEPPGGQRSYDSHHDPVQQQSEGSSYHHVERQQDNLYDDPEGKRRRDAERGDTRPVTLATGSHPTNVQGGDLFDRAARQQRMTSPSRGARGGGEHNPIRSGPDPQSSPHNTHHHHEQHQQQRHSDSYHYTGGNPNTGQAVSPGSGLQTSSQYAPHPLQTKVTNLEDENRNLRAEIDTMQRQQNLSSQLKPTSQQQLLTHAKAMLSELGKELGMHLAFDANFTCVVGSDEKNTMIVTCDIPTERIYLYSTLSSSLPADPTTRMMLYEALLEGAMLGRDMAGGGCGISLDSGLVMMSASVDLRHSDVTALRGTAPVFVESLVKWRNVVSEIIGDRGGVLGASSNNYSNFTENSVPRRSAPQPPGY